MNDEWDYSSDALNALTEFYDRKPLFFVEGDDDILFWSVVVKAFSDLNLEFQPVYSSTALDKRIEQILGNQIQAFAGRDSDYLKFNGEIPDDPRILTTAGHSIENCLFKAATIFHIVKSWCKNLNTSLDECVQWLEKFSASFKTLLVLELANFLHAGGTTVMGENCSKFMKSNSSSSACENRISEKVKLVSSQIKVRSIKGALKLCPNDVEGVLMAIRGHFLESAVQKFIAEKIKLSTQKSAFSYDALYSNAILLFESQIHAHPSHGHYALNVKRLSDWTQRNLTAA